MSFKKVFSIVLFSAIACMAANSWADSSLEASVSKSTSTEAAAQTTSTYDPISLTTTGLSTTTKGLATAISTPAVMLDNMAEGKMAEAASSAISLPVKGVINTASGAVMTVSGIGLGATNLLGQAFDATGKLAETCMWWDISQHH